MAENNGQSSENQQVLKHAQRVSRTAGPIHEERGQRILGGAKAAPAPASKSPMSALPPTAQQTQQGQAAPAQVPQSQAAPEQK